MAQIGRLGVRVYSGRAQLPVEQAAVLITQTVNGAKYFISLQQTDRSGNTEFVEILAPDMGESQHPNGGSTIPFARCDVWVEHPDYEVMIIEDVQVFAGETSLQQVELQPLLEGETWTQNPEVRPIPGQDL